MPVVQNSLPKRRGSSQALFHLVFVHKRRPRSASFRGQKKMEIGGVLNRSLGRTRGTISRCKPLRLMSWLASSGTLKVSC